MHARGFATLAIVLIVVAALIAGGVWYYESHQLTVGQNTPTASEQTHFAVEGEGYDIVQPVTIPGQVLGILEKDSDVVGCLTNEPGDEYSASWFNGSNIFLRNESQPDLIIVPENACLFGANIAPFWIFRTTAEGSNLILKVNAHDLEVTSTTTAGYKDIEVISMSAVQEFDSIYKFDGTQYELASTTTE
jgi:hypothetical protein